MRLELLPLDFKNLDEEEPHYKQLLEDVELASVLPSERLIKVLLEADNEVLGCTDRAFYVLFKNTKTYYARATLLSLILSEHAARSSIIEHVVSMLRKSGELEKAFIAASLISETTPEYLFRAYQGAENLTSALANHGRQLNVINAVVPCREFEFSEDELGIISAMHRRFCTSVELLNGRCMFGVADVGGELIICVRVGALGFVLQRAIMSAVE